MILLSKWDYSTHVVLHLHFLLSKILHLFKEYLIFPHTFLLAVLYMTMSLTTDFTTA